MKNTGSVTLSRPRHRLPIRADFPPVQNMREPDTLLQTFQQECIKHFRHMPASVIIAWPHKNPTRFDNLPPDDFVYTFEQMARTAYRNTRFFLADGLLEQRSLARASDTLQTRYAKKQHWQLSKKFQTETLPPLKGSAVVVLDDAVETGNTFVEFISFLNHNGAHVLMAAVPSMTEPVYLQFPEGDNEMDRIAALDADMRAAAAATGVAMHEGECIALVEKALNKKGYSLMTLTPGEFQEMRDEFEPGPHRINFFEFLTQDLGGTLPRRLRITLPRLRS